MRSAILGIPLDHHTFLELAALFRQWLGETRQRHIVTVNPEFVMASRHDEAFRKILQHADLAVADGFGLRMAARWLKQPIPPRVTGVELVWSLLRVAAAEGKSIFLLGASHGVAAGAAFRIIEAIPGIKIVGAESGYRGWHRKLDNKKIIAQIQRRQPDILLVALGQVKQEKWIAAHLPLLPSVKIAVGVGGTFDYISGQVRRAPAWLRTLGLEWLFRLARQPWRLPRIITAVVKFSWTVFREGKKV